MKTKASTVEGYLQSLPPDRREMVAAIRQAIRQNLDTDYEEGIQYNMIGYFVPHRVYPAGYHCNPKVPLPLAMLGSNKAGISLHFMPLYADTACEPGNKNGDYAKWFFAAWKSSGKKLDMGKACIRFKTLDDVPLNVIGEAVRKIPAKTWIEKMESLLQKTRQKPVKAKTGKSMKKKTNK